MKRKKRQDNELESPQAIAERLGDAELWIEKHRNVLMGALAVVVLAATAYFGFRYWRGQQEAEAQREMFQAVYYFEADSLNLALEGDGNNLGFMQIIDDYGVTEAARLASYYVGAIYLKQAEFESAIEYLKRFDADDVLLQARAYSLVGDAYMELEQYDEAASYYAKASSHEPNAFFTPAYLLKEALAYEKLNRHDEALETYQKIIDQYEESEAYKRAEKLRARLQAL